jgi:hypothetical protein
MCFLSLGESCWLSVFYCRLIGLRCIVRRRFGLRVQRTHERHESGYLGRTQVLTVSRHIPAALDHLTHELVCGQTRSDPVERRSTQTTSAANTVAVDALFSVKDQGALSFER